MMKFIVLGGAGDMGGQAARVFSGSAETRQTTIADENVISAHMLAYRPGKAGPEILAWFLDPQNHLESWERPSGSTMLLLQL